MAWRRSGFIIITADANAVMAAFHDRVPVILEQNRLARMVGGG